MHRSHFPEQVEALMTRIGELCQGRSGPLLVALDGRSGSGKSTLASAVAEASSAVVIAGDDFYAGGTAETWDAMTPMERAEHCIDWKRQGPVLEALRQGQPASWCAYDWDANDGRLLEQPTDCEPAPVVLLEGVYSARPELADLVDLQVLVEVPETVCRSRIIQREGEHFEPAWHDRWASAEVWYFGNVMPPSAFDLVLRDLSCSGRAGGRR